MLILVRNVALRFFSEEKFLEGARLIVFSLRHCCAHAHPPCCPCIYCRFACGGTRIRVALDSPSTKIVGEPRGPHPRECDRLQAFSEKNAFAVLLRLAVQAIYERTETSYDECDAEEA